MLQNKIVQIEPPRKSNTQIQCTRCQLYGHSKSYCNRPYLCVKCGGQHNTNICEKSNNTPAICGLCDGAHPANYKGCIFYQNLKKSNINRNGSGKPQLQQMSTVNYQGTSNKQPRLPDIQPAAIPVYTRSYADVTRNNTMNDNSHQTPMEDNHLTLTKFLEEFKQMFQQLTHQNSILLNMLTTLISKIK